MYRISFKPKYIYGGNPPFDQTVDGWKFSQFAEIKDIIKEESKDDYPDFFKSAKKPNINVLDYLNPKTMSIISLVESFIKRTVTFDIYMTGIRVLDKRRILIQFSYDGAPEVADLMLNISLHPEQLSSRHLQSFLRGESKHG